MVLLDDFIVFLYNTTHGQENPKRNYTNAKIDSHGNYEDEALLSKPGRNSFP